MKMGDRELDVLKAIGGKKNEEKQDYKNFCCNGLLAGI